MLRALPSEHCLLSAPSCPDTAGPQTLPRPHTRSPAPAGGCRQSPAPRLVRHTSSLELLHRGCKRTPSPEAALQVVCSGLVSRQLMKCHKILRKELGVSSQEPGDRFPVRLATSFPIPAPFFPPLSSEQDTSPLRAEALGGCWRCRHLSPRVCRVLCPQGGARCRDRAPALVRLIPPPARGDR